MIVGLDFDNTIASYERLWPRAVAQFGLVLDGRVDKATVRERLRALPDGEALWQAVQLDVYGFRCGAPFLGSGFESFVRRCRRAGVPLYIVSHKTERSGGQETVDLRVAATRWMTAQGFFDRDGLAFSESQVFFEATRADKIRRIAAVGCTHYVDDLEEVLLDESFPHGVARILFGSSPGAPRAELDHVETWDQLSRYLFS